ncbi:MAG: prepilin-type N-terminal cleavage/methylation domain-containing protein [Elusimicrobiota bacterium]
MMRHRKRGFTLIELMIVVAIIGILAAIAIPKFADLIRKSSEGACKGNLGSLRSALSIYYADMEGQYPGDPRSMTVNGKYLTAIPKVKTPNYHAETSAVLSGSFSAGLQETGGWIYASDHTETEFGQVFVDCTHTDTKTTRWSSY